MGAGHAVNQNYSSIQLWTIKAWLVEQPTACIDRQNRHPGAGVLSTWPPEVFSWSSLTDTANISHVVLHRRRDSATTNMPSSITVRGLYTLRSQSVPFFSVHRSDTDRRFPVSCPETGHFSSSICRQNISLTAQPTWFDCRWNVDFCSSCNRASLRYSTTLVGWSIEQCLFKTTPTKHL